MNKISKLDYRYSVLLNIPKKLLIFNSHDVFTYTMVIFSGYKYCLILSEYQNLLRYIMHKNGEQLDETRIIIY